MNFLGCLTTEKSFPKGINLIRYVVYLPKNAKRVMSAF